MSNLIYKNVLERIQLEEKTVSLHTDGIIDETFRMVGFLNGLLSELKAHVLERGFSGTEEEIDFFKRVKPQVLGKLFYYNKISRIETSRPVNDGELYGDYYSEHLRKLKKEFREHVRNSDFYRYYRSGRTDRDGQYFTLGHINFYDGLNSFIFDMDTHFTTFYDHKIARILASEQLYSYLLRKMQPYVPKNISVPLVPPDEVKLRWTGSKNALVELIYALYVSGSISNGNVGLKKLGMFIEIVLQVQLGDIHHAFHRMKDRASDRTLFLNHLKQSLERYMDKNL